MIFVCWSAWSLFAAQHGHNLKLIVMIFVSATNCKMNWINSNEEIGSIDVLSAKPAFQPYVDGPAQHLQFCASDPGVEHLQEYVHLQLILVWIIAVLCNKKCCSLQHCDEITVNALCNGGANPLWSDGNWDNVWPRFTWTCLASGVRWPG